MIVHSLARSSPLQTHRVLSKNPPFSSSSLHQSSRKGMGFDIFLMYFLFLTLDFLDCVFLLRFENMMLNMVCEYFVEFDEWFLLVFGSMMPTIHVFMFSSHF